MKKFLFLLFFSSFIFCQCPPDTTGYQVIRDLTICFTKFSVDVKYHPDCTCYYYTYNIISSELNKSVIESIYYKFSTSKEYPILDLSLPYNEICDPPFGYMRHIYINRSLKEIPHSYVSCPTKWEAGSNHRGFDCVFDEYKLKPGQSMSFTIASKFPPGERKFLIEPDCYRAAEEWASQFPPDDTEEHFPGDANPPLALCNVYSIWVDSFGPVDPEELDLFNGGGQKPDDVNLFLRYARPKETQTELPSGTAEYEILIYYGKTIKPETFKAELNGIDITPYFYPNPGGGDLVKIQLKSGRNTLVLSVDGINQKGNIANDKDRLVFIVK